MTDTQIRNMMETINTIKKSLEIDGGLAFEYYKALLEVGYERDVTYENKLNQFKSEMKNFRESVEVKLEELDKVTKVNMSKNNWIAGSSTGDTIKGVLDKEFDLAKDSIIGGTINYKDATIKIPKGEYIIPKSDAEKLLKQLDVEKGKLESIKKQKEELEEKIHSHNADKDESDDIGKLLDEAGKIFNVVFNVNGETKKSAQDLVKDMANELKKRGIR